MFRLHVVQAYFGDCLILEYGTFTPRYILIDGGPGKTYKDHLEPVLTDLQKTQGQWDALVLTHVDEDHVAGLLKLTRKLKAQQNKDKPLLLNTKTLWFNSYSDAVGKEGKKDLAKGLGSAPETIPYAEAVSKSIKQGNDFSDDAQFLDIWPPNRGFLPNLLMTVDKAPVPLATLDNLDLDNLELRVVGPTEKNLEGLRDDWQKWIKDQAKKPKPKGKSKKAIARDLDDSVANVSSIMLYAKADGKTMLLTGDGRGDHLIEGLGKAGLLNPDGKLHVNVLKLPHHGSVRNVSPEFFHTITADTYVISADGTNGNPDPPTLEWLITAAQKQGRHIRILLTNRPPHIDTWEKDFTGAGVGYEWLGPAPEGQHELVLPLS